METISNIKDYIDDAFEVWTELDCDLDGLLGYVSEYNECFLTERENTDRAVHIILFAYEAIRRGHDLSTWIEQECNRAIQFLQRENPSILEDEISFLQKKA